MLPKVTENRLYGRNFNKNGRLEKVLKQSPLIDSVETTHHRPAKPTVVSTTGSIFDIALYGLYVVTRTEI